jgi:transposase
MCKMEDKSKPNLGLRNGNRLYFSDREKKLIINDYLSGNETKKSVYKRYTGYNTENGKIIMWMRKFGIEDSFIKNPNFEPMPKRKKEDETGAEEFEILNLKKRIEELEKQVQTAEMKAIAFSTMVDIAEKEFNIPIRKKYSTKPSKK